MVIGRHFHEDKRLVLSLVGVLVADASQYYFSRMSPKGQFICVPTIDFFFRCLPPRVLPIDILSVPVYRIFNNVKDYVAIIDTYDLLSSMEVNIFGRRRGVCRNGIQFAQRANIRFLVVINLTADMHGYLFLFVSSCHLDNYIRSMDLTQTRYQSLQSSSSICRWRFWWA